MLKSLNALTEEEPENVYSGGSNTTNKKALEVVSRLRLDYYELAVTAELEQLLALVFECTMALEGDGITISRVLPYIKSLKTKLKQMNLHHVKDARDKLVSSLDERFDFLETNHLFGVTSLFDPNFGKYWLKGGRELESWIEKLAYLRLGD
jgi:hypothetical protein